MTKILVIEDNPENSRLIEKILKKHGFECVLKEDAVAGLEYLATNPVDLVLLDMALPVMTGWEAARRLKANEKTRTLPVVACTAHAMAGDRERAIAAGCDGFISKPFRSTELLAAIRSRLPAKPG